MRSHRGSRRHSRMRRSRSSSGSRRRIISRVRRVIRSSVSRMS